MSRRSTWWFVGLTGLLCRVSLHRFTEYRVDFLVGVSSLAVRVLCQVALIGTAFRYVDTLVGWGYSQALFLVGFAMLPRGLDRLFTDQLFILAWNLVRTGDFFRYLIRPVHPLYMLLSERFLYPDAIGELVVGIAIVVTAAAGSGVELGPEEWLLMVPLTICGALLHGSIKCLMASIAFWTTSSLSMMSAVTQLGDFATYPLEVYPPALRVVLTWVVPYAFTAYVPAHALLFGASGALLWLLPVTALTICVALAVHQRGVARFEMTGN